MENRPLPLVSICCITYNHENYIRDAIDGFLMQKTDFPLEIIIRDDASTDRTTGIVREYQSAYPDLFRCIYHTQNQFSLGKRAFPEVFNLARGKYIALCEGDDYWTDALKLQKQVDFLETHPECSLCCHKVLTKFENHEEKNVLFPEIYGDQVFSREEMHGKYISATCSVLFRREKIDQLVAYLDGFKVGDIPLYFFFLEFGSFGYIDQVMGVYRKNEKSYWHPNYEKLRFPVLFDTFVKIKSKLAISHSEGLDRQISFYALGLLEEFFRKQKYKDMRDIVLRSYRSYFSVKKKWRRSQLFKYSLIAFFPFIYSIFRTLHIKVIDI